MHLSQIPYDDLLIESRASSLPVGEYLRQALPRRWLEAYPKMTSKPPLLHAYRNGAFDFISDLGVKDLDAYVYSRVVYAIGVSTPYNPDPSVPPFLDGGVDGDWQTGHFIPNAIGGRRYDGAEYEANVFDQRTSMDRHEIADYCRRHPGVLCFCRPLYDDMTERPCELEFGVLKTTGEWWIELFDNRPAIPDK
jgi:hypothetical protein